MLKALHRTGLVLPYVFFLIAALVVHRQVTTHPIGEIIDGLTNIPASHILLGCVLTVVNYVAMSGYDWLGTVYAGHKVPYRRILLASLISYAISNNTGHALVTGTSVRYRFYNASGVPGWDILKIAVFSVVTFTVAAFSLEAGLSLFFPDAMKQGQAAPGFVHGITIISAAALGSYWAAILFLREPIRIRNYEIRMPSVRLGILQTIIGVADLVLGASILYIFLQTHASMPFIGFLAIYVLALLAGLISQVPGGIGVFEGAFIWLAGPEFSAPHILSALVMYRIVYFFLPLALSGFGLFFYELKHHGERLAQSGTLLSIAIAQSIPAIFSLMIFFAGAVLLISGATPAESSHVAFLRHHVPLAVMELSHLASSLCGILLLFLARPARVRVRSAWIASVLVLAFGAAACILRGLDWKEALLMCFVLMLLLPTRRVFDRTTPLMSVALTREWAAMIAVVLIGSSWIGFFAYRHMDPVEELWWKFSYRGDAARFVRALILSVAAVAFYGAYRLVKVKRIRHFPAPEDSDIAKAGAIARSGHSTESFLALLGDKHILWSDDGTAFIMYAATPRYWIAMSDPSGNPQAFENVAWKFRELAAQYEAQAVFYQVSDRNLPLYLDLGMVMLKIGEEALVRLETFSLSGGKRENQRKGRNRFLREGYALRYLSAAELDAAMPRLKSVSDAWLERKNTREKGFSLGYFDENYLRRTRVAVIEKDAEILAFANVWALDGKDRIAVDLMRYDPAAPQNVMEFLLIELMMRAQEEGYAWFSLGMAPLSGLEKHPLAPLWHKIGNVIFEHGEEFYNFEGLYAYKSKFDPEWHPRYLAAPSGMRVPLVLMSIAGVIAGGLQGVFRK